MLRETIDRINALLDIGDKPTAEKADSEWEAEYDARDLVPEIYRLHRWEEDGDLTTSVQDCGSSPIKDTPAGLYRLLYLFAAQGGRWPAGKIAPQPGSRPWLLDFGDIGKSCGLFGILSPGGEFVAQPYFYKYELALGWRASREHIVGRERGVLCGVPGSDNGVNAASEELKAWQALLVRMLEREWDVYSGNGFRV
jgi:hypothetical protein